MATASDGFASCVRQDRDSSNQKLATQWIVYTNLGLQLLRGPSGLHVAVRSLERGTPLPGVDVELVSTANRVLVQAVSDGGSGWYNSTRAWRAGFWGTACAVFSLLLRVATSPSSMRRPIRSTLVIAALRGARRPVRSMPMFGRSAGSIAPGETIEAMVMVRNDQAMAIDPPPLQLRFVVAEAGRNLSRAGDRHGLQGGCGACLTATAPRCSFGPMEGRSARRRRCRGNRAPTGESLRAEPDRAANHRS